MTKQCCFFIFINMVKIFNKISSTFRQKKSLFIFLVVFSLVMIVLGVVASINFSGGVLVVDLSNISYIQFLKDECGFASLIFKLFLSLFIFLCVIWGCGKKSFLFPIGILFYGYLVYSQTVIFVSMILIYGFFNCVIFALILFAYIMLIFFLFMLFIMEVSCCCNSTNYFKITINWNNSNILFSLIFILLITILFCIILTILKSFVLLLIY